MNITKLANMIPHPDAATVVKAMVALSLELLLTLVVATLLVAMLGN